MPRCRRQRIRRRCPIAGYICPCAGRRLAVLPLIRVRRLAAGCRHAERYLRARGHRLRRRLTCDLQTIRIHSAAARADTAHIVMTQRRNSLGLLFAASGAGVCPDTGSGTGCSDGNGTGIPGMCMGLCRNQIGLRLLAAGRRTLCSSCIPAKALHPVPGAVDQGNTDPDRLIGCVQHVLIVPGRILPCRHNRRYRAETTSNVFCTHLGACRETHGSVGSGMRIVHRQLSGTQHSCFQQIGIHTQPILSAFLAVIIQQLQFRIR